MKVNTLNNRDEKYLKVTNETVKGFDLSMGPTRNAKFSALLLEDSKSNIQIF